MSARKKSGFTLIELLVVIAIIAILAAILFPVFARAREAARKSTCQSNMKECAIALHTYWNDYDATLPSSRAQNPGRSGWSATDYSAFATRLGVVPVPANDTPKTWPQMLYNSMKSKDIMFCPSDSRNSDKNPTGYVSYYWKLAIDRAWEGTSSNKWQKEADFGYVSDQIVLHEAAGFHSSASSGLRNGVQINVAFLDTHCKNVTLVNSAPDTGPFQTDMTALSGEPCYFNFDNDSPKGDQSRRTGKLNPPRPGELLVPSTDDADYWDPSAFSDMLP